jgi:hypothetical protein
LESKFTFFEASTLGINLVSSATKLSENWEDLKKHTQIILIIVKAIDAADSNTTVQRK